MNGRCSCGAIPPEDARFCHKCGRPLREEDAAAPAELQPQPAATVAEAVPPPLPPAYIAQAQGITATAAAEPRGPSFSNGVAVRVGLFAAGLICLLINLPMPVVFGGLWAFLLLFAGGFFSVYLYSRRTGEHLTVGKGARMGWITGIFCFLIVAVFFTIGIIGVASGQGLETFFRDLIAQAGTAESSQQLNELLKQPGGLGVLVFGSLFTMFLMLTILPVIGGALGAKVLEKEN